MQSFAIQTFLIQGWLARVASACLGVGIPLAAWEATTAAELKVTTYAEATGGGYVAGQFPANGLLSGKPPPVGLGQVQFMLEGDPVPNFAFLARLEARQSTAPRLAEGYVSVRGDWFDVGLGHIRPPLGSEVLTRDWDLPAIGRSRFSGMAADPGPGTPRPFQPDADGAVQATVVAGSTATMKAWAGSKDAAVRLEAHPLPAIGVGAHYLGSYPEAVSGLGERWPFRDRWGADASWGIGPFLFAAEFLRGYEANSLGGCFSTGAYAYGLWDFWSGQRLMLRYEMFSPEYPFRPDLLAASALAASYRSQTVLLGWSIAPARGLRLQIQYAHDWLPVDRNGDAVRASASLLL